VVAENGVTVEVETKGPQDYGRGCGIRAPDPDAPPFEEIEPIQTRGIPASRMLIADRR
jgi:hypothetical protein